MLSWNIICGSSTRQMDAGSLAYGYVMSLQLCSMRSLQSALTRRLYPILHYMMRQILMHSNYAPPQAPATTEVVETEQRNLKHTPRHENLLNLVPTKTPVNPSNSNR